MGLEDKVVNIFTAADNEQKEKFAVGMSDVALINQITAWEREADDFYTFLTRVWLENLAYYKGIQTGSDRIQGKRSKTVENRIFMAVETAIPIVTARLPDTVVRPGQDDEQSLIDAQELQDVLAYHFERLQIQEQAEKYVRDMIVKRYGVWEVGWDKDNDDVDLYLCDPRRLKFPKFGRTVQELAFIIKELELSYNSLVKYFGKEKAETVRKLGIKRTDTQIREKTYPVQAVWTNDFLVYRYGGEILDKKPNPYFNFDNVDNNFFSSPNKPFIIKSLFETEECIVGDTDYIQQVMTIQDNINNRKRQIEDIASQVSNPYLLVDSNVMSEEEAQAITNEPGYILYGNDAALGTKIRFERPGEVSQALFQDLQTSRDELDNIWGIHSTTRGERQGRETLGGRQILREADIGRIDLLARKLERALDEVAEWWTQLIKLFYTEDKAFTIMGEDGAKFVKTFSGKKVGKNVKPMVKQGSTLKEDEYAIQQKAILLWQSKAIGLRTLYKMIHLPNVQQAIDDFKETQGAVAQPGQPPIV